MQRMRRTSVLILLALLGLIVAIPLNLLAAPSSRTDDDPKKKQENRSGATDQSSKKRPKKHGKKPSDKGKKKKKKRRGKVDLSPIPVDERKVAKFLQDLGEDYKVKHTAHYSVFYNTSEDDLSIFTAAIEKTYGQCGRYIHNNLGLEVTQPKYKLFTHYFNTFEQYSLHSARIGHGFVQEGTLGFYVPVQHDPEARIDPGSNMTYFYNIRNTPAFRARRQAAEQRLREIQERARRGGRLSPGERRANAEAAKEARRTLNETNTFGGGLTEETLQHEVTHQVLFNIGFHKFGSAWANPRWLAEGMAQVFQTKSDGERSGIMLVNRDILTAFLNLDSGRHLVPLRDFIGDPRYFFRSDAGSLAYPQGWGLAHYITRTKRKELKAYVEEILNRPVYFETTPEKEIETFERAFGPLDEQWEERWLRWMRKVG
jgi:hypothetical protein